MIANYRREHEGSRACAGITIGDYRLYRDEHNHQFFMDGGGTRYDLDDLVPEPVALAGMFEEPMARRTFRDMVRDAAEHLARLGHANLGDRVDRRDQAH